jgi:hypothetical protein
MENITPAPLIHGQAYRISTGIKNQAHSERERKSWCQTAYDWTIKVE